MILGDLIRRDTGLERHCALFLSRSNTAGYWEPDEPRGSRPVLALIKPYSGPIRGSSMKDNLFRPKT